MLDYDEYYDTVVNRSYGYTKLAALIGLSLVLVGCADIAITIVDMYVSNYNQGGTAGSNYVYTWDENPFWPTYGKGFWVGLVVLAAGLLGLVSTLETTITSILSFCALCLASAVFSFYLLITTTIPLAKYTNIGDPSDVKNYGNYYYNSLIFNSILMGLGGVGFLLSLAGAYYSAFSGQCFQESRGYGGAFLNKFYKSRPANVPIFPDNQQISM